MVKETNVGSAMNGLWSFPDNRLNVMLIRYLVTSTYNTFMFVIREKHPQTYMYMYVHVHITKL